jgi:hypothetical protein
VVEKDDGLTPSQRKHLKVQLERVSRGKGEGCVSVRGGIECGPLLAPRECDGEVAEYMCCMGRTDDADPPMICDAGTTAD